MVLFHPISFPFPSYRLIYCCKQPQTLQLLLTIGLVSMGDCFNKFLWFKGVLKGLDKYELLVYVVSGAITAILFFILFNLCDLVWFRVMNCLWLQHQLLCMGTQWGMEPWIYVGTPLRLKVAEGNKYNTSFLVKHFNYQNSKFMIDLKSQPFLYIWLWDGNYL